MYPMRSFSFTARRLLVADPNWLFQLRPGEDLGSDGHVINPEVCDARFPVA